jgi:hypothetical protein
MFTSRSFQTHSMLRVVSARMVNSPRAERGATLSHKAQAVYSPLVQSLLQRHRRSFEKYVRTSFVSSFTALVVGRRGRDAPPELALGAARHHWIIPTFNASIAAGIALPGLWLYYANPTANLSSYTTYGFVPQPCTNRAGNTTPLTPYFETSISREMDARGFSDGIVDTEAMFPPDRTPSDSQVRCPRPTHLS